MESDFVDAAYKGDLDRLRDLLNGGADVNEVDKIGWTALVGASANGQQACVEELLKAGADVNYQDVDYEDSALMLAAECGYPEIVRMLLKAGAEIEQKDCLGETALLKAVYGASMSSANGCFEVVKLLLDAGADIDTHDRSGMTPLINAVVSGEPDFVRFLLDRGADIERYDCRAATALMYSVSGLHFEFMAHIPCNPRTVKVLLEYGANVNETGLGGKTALDLAVNEEVAQLLIEAGAKRSSEL